jgi:hypothetical protein
MVPYVALWNLYLSLPIMGVPQPVNFNMNNFTHRSEGQPASRTQEVRDGGTQLSGSTLLSSVGISGML